MMLFTFFSVQLAQQRGAHAVAPVRVGRVPRGVRRGPRRARCAARARALLGRLGPHAADRRCRTAHARPALQDSRGSNVKLFCL